MNWYCDVAPGHPVHQPYHDLEYGFPLTGEAELLERLALEIFQAGLSWEIVLRKRSGTRLAFTGFDVDAVAGFAVSDVERLLGDHRIIRNRRKVAAVIENAKRIRALRASHGGFAAWIAGHHPLPLAGWVRLFRQTFVFTGPEVVNEFLMSIGYLPGAHRADCPIQAAVDARRPPWMDADPAVFAGR